MAGAQYFGYVLVGVSAVLLAQHWQHWRDLATRPLRERDRNYFRLQLQRRSVASSLIGVVGAAMTLADRVPRTPWSLTTYLIALLLGGTVILAIAIVDMRAARRHREVEQLDLVARELQKVTAGGPESESTSPSPSGRGLG